MTTARRYSWGASIAAIVPCLLAGIILGGFLKPSRAVGVASPGPKAPEHHSDRTALGPAAGAAAGAPTDAPKAAEVNANPRTLSARLSDYAAAVRKCRAILADEKERENLDRRLQDLRREAGDPRDLREAIFADPASYLAFLKDPANEEVLSKAIGLLGWASDVVSSSMLSGLEKIPRPILDGIYGLMSAGTLGQKLAILQSFESLEIFGIREPSARADLEEHCLPLLSGSEDPRVRAKVLKVLEVCRAGSMDDYLDVVRELLEKSTDPQVRSDCLRALGRMKSPQSEELFLDRSRSAIREASSADPAAAYATLGVLERRAALTPLESMGRYLEVWSLGFREIRQPDLYLQWMDASTSLPVKQLGPLFEQAASSAPTPELQAHARYVLEQIRSGETRVEQLRHTVWGRPRKAP